MIKMWISQTEATATVECAVHDAEKLKAAKYSPGFFVTKEELEQLQREAIDAEPELPGEMPDEMFIALNTADKDAMAEMLRIIVRQTKAGIKQRFNDYLSSKSKEVRSE